jgi:hypothetical protein
MSDSAVDRPIVDAEQPRKVGPAQTRPEHARQTAFRSRFAALYLVLAVVAGAAIGAFVVLLARPDAPPTPAWSAAAPNGTTAKRLRWIASTVGRQYRFPDGTQLLQPVATRPSLPNADANPRSQLPLVAIVERPDYSKGEKEDFANTLHDPQLNAQFTMCAGGTNCSFPADTGEATPERFLLLQRQALELGLYTFKYAPELETVTVFFPPRRGTDLGSGTVALLRRGDYAGALGRPLAATLDPVTPTIGEVSATDQLKISELTQGRLFTYQFRQSQDTGWILIVDPLANVVP